jgi:hypothetical protein
MSTWEEANKKLAEARKKREAERGTSKTTNPLMEDFKKRMEKREIEKAKEDLKTQKKEARKAKRQFSTQKDKFQYVGPNGKEYMGPGGGPKRERKAKKEEAAKKAPRRRPTGRQEMIAQRYMDNEKRKKEGGSSVVES